MRQFTGKQYLQIDIANNFGHDKLNWDERLAWFQENQQDLLADPVKAVVKADEPAQALAGLLAYQDMLLGKPIGYTCGLDATASGLQLLSLLAGCEQSASTCNLINTGRREDAYTLSYAEVNALLGTAGKIPRGDVKQAVMTHLYSSKKVPERVFGVGTPELKAFYEVVDKLFPGADALNRGLVSLWNPEATEHTWTLPDGFDVVIKSMVPMDEQVTFLGQTFTVTSYVQAPQDESRCLGANIVHSIDGMVVREMNRRCNYTADVINAFQELYHSQSIGMRSTTRRKDIQLLRLIELADLTGFVSAVFFEYLDEDNYGHLDQRMRNQLMALVNTLPTTSFPLLAIHDCFKFHPNYGNDVRRQYTQILAELVESSILDPIVTEVAGRPITVNKGTLTAAQIQASEYAIT